MMVYSDAEWSGKMGLSMDLSARGFGKGLRTARYAMIINDLKIEYLGVSSIVHDDAS